MKTWETEDQLDRDERFVSARQNANARQIGGTHYVDMAVQPWEVMEAVLVGRSLSATCEAASLSTACAKERKKAQTMQASLSTTSRSTKK